VRNSTAVASVCATLTADECHNWLECCAAARACCTRQMSVPASVPAVERNVSSTPWCSRTWDGFSCFDDTPPSTVAVLPCPTFMRLADTSRTLKRNSFHTRNISVLRCQTCALELFHLRVLFLLLIDFVLSTLIIITRSKQAQACNTAPCLRISDIFT